MKKFEYTKGNYMGRQDKLAELEQGKQDDYYLPEFSKEIPTSSDKKENDDAVTVQYSWRECDSPSLKIRRIDFRKGEDLGEFYKANARDGADSICVQHKNITYILRKTAREVAYALYAGAHKIKGGVESIVGYLRSVLGNDYVISKVEGEAWSFDKRIAREHITYVELDKLSDENRDKLRDMIVETISKLHSNNFIIGRFSLNNILLGKDSMKLSDLRKLRASRKRSFVVDEFRNIMQYLFAVGIAQKEDTYSSVAMYAAVNEESCNEWYKSETGKEPVDELDVACKIEEEIHS